MFGQLDEAVTHFAPLLHVVHVAQPMGGPMSDDVAAGESSTDDECAAVG